MCEHPKDALVKLWLEELRYDVKFDSWQKDRVFNRQVRNRDKTAGKVTLAYDDDRANDWLTRQIDTAVNNIYGELAWCTRDATPFETDEIEKHSPFLWVVCLRFAPSWAGSVRHLKSLMHNYVVQFVLAQWYKASNEPSWQAYAQEAELALNKVYNEARSERVTYKPWTL